MHRSLAGTLRRRREMSRDAVTHLLADMGMRVRISSFRGIDRIGERFDFNRRLLLQSPLFRSRQAEPEPNAQLVQESFHLAFIQLRCHVK